MAIPAEIPDDLAARIPERSIVYANVEEGRAARRDETHVADCLVIGSGAGGAVAACLLAEAGLDVLILEEGGLYKTEAFSTNALEMMRALYRDCGASMILGKPGIVFVEGRCVGGSTVINGGMCWRTPEKILERWERDERLAEIGPKSMEPIFAEIEREVNPETQQADTLGVHNRLFADGARKLGWHPRENLRNMRRCAGLNNCAFGCPTGAKQSMLVTYVPRALRAGARLVTDARVDRVLFDGVRAVGVRGRFVGRNGRPSYRFSAHAPLVVLAAGARHTPGILKRSWLRARAIGRNLKVHPNAKVVGIFEEIVNPWWGTHQAHQIHDFLDEGLLIGYAVPPPGILAGAMPGIGEENAERMALYNHMFPVGCLVEDTSSGRVVLGPDRQPQMLYSLSRRDAATTHEGVAKSCELLFAAGAKRCLLPFADLAEIRSPDETRRIRERPPNPRGIELMTVHIMGSARMTSDPRSGATDPFGRVFDVPGLYVADASLFPSSVGVNPQETIMALVVRNVRRWLETDVVRLRARRRRHETAPAARGPSPADEASQATVVSRDYQDYEDLARLTRREHDEIFAAGSPPALDDLAGWEFSGWNCSLVPRLAGFQKFVKGFYRGPEHPSGECAGFNAAVIQNGIDGEWLALPADDEPRRFGFYRVSVASPADLCGAPRGALLLDYGAHPANPRLDVSRLLRDVLVRVDGRPDLLLGKAHLDLSRWLFVGYFLLRRRRRHHFQG